MEHIYKAILLVYSPNYQYLEEDYPRKVLPTVETPLQNVHEISKKSATRDP